MFPYYVLTVVRTKFLKIILNANAKILIFQKQVTIIK